MVVLPVPFKVAVVRRWVEVAEEPNFRNTEIRPFHHDIDTDELPRIRAPYKDSRERRIRQDVGRRHDNAQVGQGKPVVHPHSQALPEGSGRRGIRQSHHRRKGHIQEGLRRGHRLLLPSDGSSVQDILHVQPRISRIGRVQPRRNPRHRPLVVRLRKRLRPVSRFRRRGHVPRISDESLAEQDEDLQTRNQRQRKTQGGATREEGIGRGTEEEGVSGG